MALESIGIAASFAGLINLGISVCHGILEYYSSWKDAEDDLKRMYSSAEALTKTLVVLRRSIQHNVYGPDIVARVEECMSNCEDGIASLQRKLSKIKVTTQTGERRSQRFKAKLQRASYPFRESTLIKLMEICDDLQNDLGLAMNALQIDAAAVTLQKLGDLGSDIGDISLEVNNLNTQLGQTSKWVGELHSTQKDNSTHLKLEQHLLEVYEWLSPLSKDFASKQFDTFNTAARQDRLGRWLLGTTEYGKWQLTPGSTLWCLGIRGVGKTVLASFIINTLQQLDQGNVAVAYLYCNYSEVERQNATNLMSSVLQQLVVRKAIIIEELMELYKKHSQTKTPPSLQECYQLLELAAIYIPNAFIIIDALDECAEVTRDLVLTKIRKILPKARLLITSRYTVGSEYNQHDQLRLEIEANDTDIKCYLEQRIDESQSLQAHIKKDHELHNSIVSSIISRTNGMFLLARLHLDSLMAKTTLRKVRSALISLPEELDKMYDQVLDRIRNQDPDHGVLALKILGWIHHAARPLKVLEIQHALATELGDTYFDEDGIPETGLILAVCAGIVAVRENDTMAFVHYTAQEYLERRTTDIFPHAPRDIVLTCLTYVSFEEFAQGPCNDDEAFELRLRCYPLLPYASKYWAVHGRGDGEMEVMALALPFLRQNSMLMSSIQVLYAKKTKAYRYSQKFIHAVGSLWFAATFGLSTIAASLLNDGADIEAKDSKAQRPLHQASMEGFSKVVKQLLDHGAEVDATGDLGRTAMHWAVVNGHQQTTQLLVARGSSVTACDARKWTALHLAASGGHEALTRFLVDQGADIEARDAYGATALYRSAESGDVESARILIERGSKVDVTNDFDQSALHRAADVGHLAVTKLLLEYGADFKGKDYYGWTPLYRAADHGHEEVAKLLSSFRCI